MFNIVEKRKWYFLGSGLIILIGVISLIVSGMNAGLDFKPGVTMTLLFEQSVDQEDLRGGFTDLGYPEAVIQHSPKEAFLLYDTPLAPQDVDKLAVALEDTLNTSVRSAGLSPQSAGNGTIALILGRQVSADEFGEELNNVGYGNTTFQISELDSFLVRIGQPDDSDAGNVTGQSEQNRIKTVLIEQFGPTDYLDYDSISQAIASERIRYTGYALLVAAIGMLIYIAWAFRRLASSFRFGVCAILALIHDVMIIITVFSLFRIEVNSFFIIAILTVIGYGVNNIIVVFDRIRENRVRHLSAPFHTIVNISITETLTRSLNTSLTTLLVLLALLFFGGSTIQDFVLALTIGVIGATYSSLFIAGELLVAWEYGELGRLFRWIPLRRRSD